MTAPQQPAQSHPVAEAQQDDERDVQVEAIADAIRECAENTMTAEEWAEGLYDCGIRSLPAQLGERQ